MKVELLNIIENIDTKGDIDHEEQFLYLSHMFVSPCVTW